MMQRPAYLSPSAITNWDLTVPELLNLELNTKDVIRLYHTPDFTQHVPWLDHDTIVITAQNEIMRVWPRPLTYYDSINECVNAFIETHGYEPRAISRNEVTSDLNGFSITGAAFPEEQYSFRRRYFRRLEDSRRLEE